VAAASFGCAAGAVVDYLLASLLVYKQKAAINHEIESAASAVRRRLDQCSHKSSPSVTLIRNQSGQVRGLQISFHSRICDFQVIPSPVA